jgi:hypothetical protein
MPWCNIYISVPAVGCTDQNMQETINSGCYRKLLYFLRYINILNWRYTKKQRIVKFVVRVPFEIPVLYNRCDITFTDTHT